VAGCYVTEGEMNRNSRARLLRDGVVVYDGTFASLKRFKDDVRSVAAGFECGVGLEAFNDVKEGDVIEAYQVQEVPRD
jgi:translation initiation factor IF-2